MIMNHMQKKQEKDRKNRDKIKNKVQDMYERMMQDAEEEDDTKFNRIASHLDRLLRIMRVQSNSIDSVERRMEQLAKLQRKPRRETQVELVPEQKEKFNRTNAFVQFNRVEESRFEDELSDDNPLARLKKMAEEGSSTAIGKIKVQERQETKKVVFEFSEPEEEEEGEDEFDV